MSSESSSPLPRSPRRPAIVALTFCGVLATLLSYVAWKFDLDEPPSTSGDEIEYDSMAWELSQGRGFAIDVRNETFREPYERAARADPARFTIRDSVPGPALHRPPLYPMVVSGINRLLGRQFLGVRVVNIAAMAGIAALLAGFLCDRVRAWSLAASLLLFLAVDVRTRLYGRAILTEALSALLVALLFWSLLELRNSGKSKWALRVGAVFGLAILTRTMFVLWTPFVAWLVWRAGRPPNSASGSTKLVLAFLFASGTLVAPWGIRNCLVTGRFLPLGTQGQVELAAGFSDWAWESRGVWVNLEARNFFHELDLTGKSSVEQQLLKADFSQRHAFEWIREKPGKATALALLKIGQELRPRCVTEGILLLLAMAGWFALRGTDERAVLGGLILANLFAIAVTWSVEGRFMVPLMFPQHVLVAAAVAKVFKPARSTPNRDVSSSPKE